MENKKVLIIDIDGVACDHAKGICHAVNKDFGLNSKPDDVTTWDYNFGPITFVEAVEKFFENMSVEKFYFPYHQPEVLPTFHELNRDFSPFLNMIQ